MTLPTQQKKLKTKRLTRPPPLPKKKGPTPPPTPPPAAVIRRPSPPPMPTVVESGSQTDTQEPERIIMATPRPPMIDMFAAPPPPIQPNMMRLPNLANPPPGPGQRMPWPMPGAGGPGMMMNGSHGFPNRPPPGHMPQNRPGLLGDGPNIRPPFAQENIRPNFRPPMGPLAQLTSLLPALEKAKLAAQQAQNKAPLSTNSASNVNQSLDHRLGIKPLRSGPIDPMDMDMSPGEDDCE